MSAPFGPLLSLMASEIEDLHAKDRFHRLRLQEVEYDSRFSTALNKLLVDADASISREVVAHGNNPAWDQRSKNLAAFGAEYQKFLQNLNILVTATFESHVYEYLKQELDGFAYADQVDRLDIHDVFPLYRELKTQHALRYSVYQAFFDGGMVGQPTNTMGSQVKNSNHQIQLFANVAQAYKLAIHTGASQPDDTIRQEILRCINLEEPRDLATQIFRLENPDGITVFKRVLDRIWYKESLVLFLEQYGAKNSVALKEEREYLNVLQTIRDDFNEVIESMLKEYRGLMG